MKHTKDKEIAELRVLVKDAYREGYEDGLREGLGHGTKDSWVGDWNFSNAKITLGEEPTHD